MIPRHFNPDGETLATCREILNRAYGKSAQPLVQLGADGEPVEPVATGPVDKVELARRGALVLIAGDRENEKRKLRDESGRSNV